MNKLFKTLFLDIVLERHVCIAAETDLCTEYIGCGRRKRHSSIRLALAAWKIWMHLAWRYFVFATRQWTVSGTVSWFWKRQTLGIEHDSKYCFLNTSLSTSMKWQSHRRLVDNFKNVFFRENCITVQPLMLLLSILPKYCKLISNLPSLEVGWTWFELNLEAVAPTTSSRVIALAAQVVMVFAKLL